MSAYCVLHFILLSVFFALFAVTVSTKPNLEDVVERLMEVETRLLKSEKETDLLRETTLLQKKIIENQEIRIQSLETEVADQRGVIRTNRESHADTDGLPDKPRTMYPSRIQSKTNSKQKRASLKNRIRSSDENCAKLPRNIFGGGIAFTAFLDHDEDYGQDQTIKYNQVITNDGSGYNQYTGVFTCPQGGMYMFTFVLGERTEPGTEVARQIWAYLVVNNQVKIVAASDTRHGSEDAQGGNTVVLRLRQGDSVWVKTTADGYHIHGNTSGFSSFTGIYLYP